MTKIAYQIIDNQSFIKFWDRRGNPTE